MHGGPAMKEKRQFIPITDEAALAAAECPFKPGTLRAYFSKGKYPGLLVKRGKRLYVVRDQIEESLRSQR